jgi:hypothetical protein
VLFAGVIIRQEQAFGLGIHHHKGRTLAVKSQCLVASGDCGYPHTNFIEVVNQSKHNRIEEE